MERYQLYFKQFLYYLTYALYGLISGKANEISTLDPRPPAHPSYKRRGRDIVKLFKYISFKIEEM